MGNSQPSMDQNCNQAGPYGTFPGQAFPHILCFSFSLKYLDNSVWCLFPALFLRCRNPQQNGRYQLRDDCEHLGPGLLEPNGDMTSPSCFLIISLSKLSCNKSILHHALPHLALQSIWKRTSELTLVVGNSAANAGHTGTPLVWERSHMQGRAQLSLWLQLLKPPCPRAQCHTTKEAAAMKNQRCT